MSVLSSLKSILTDISVALRYMNNTSKKYAISEIADAIREGCQVYYLGQGTAFDVTGVAGYQNFTEDNFIVTAMDYSTKLAVWTEPRSSDYAKDAYLTWSYQKEYSNGKLTITHSGAQEVGAQTSVNSVSAHSYMSGSSPEPKVYLVVGDIKTL